MKKNSTQKATNSTTKVTIIVICLVLLVVGYYAYLSNRSMERRNENSVDMTLVQKVLSRDLANDYPATPKEVMKYYNELMKCFYNEECTDEEIDSLGYKARELYDKELLANNEIGSYLLRLHAEIDAFKESKKSIISTSVPASANVEFYEVDGHSFARLVCGYNVMDGGITKSMKTVYLLRKDEKKCWKIYGWEAESNVDLNVENETE